MDLIEDEYKVKDVTVELLDLATKKFKDTTDVNVTLALSSACCISFCEWYVKNENKICLEKSLDNLFFNMKSAIEEIIPKLRKIK